jgi:(2Fe-2S) ferredoxin
MKSEKLSTKKEIFVCNFKREDGENCFDRGAKEITDNLKSWAKEHHKNELKVIRSGCLGKCSQGVAILCYPEKNFLLEVNSEDIPEIKKGLEEALKKD